MLQEVGSTDKRSFRRTSYAIGKAGFSCIAAVLEIVAILFASLLSGTVYHLVVYGVIGPITDFIGFGLLSAACFVLAFALRGKYVVERYLDRTSNFAEVFATWSYAILAMTLIGFLANTTDSASRGWLLLFYALGLATLSLLNDRMRMWVVKAVRTGLVAPRRIMLIGDAERISRFAGKLPSEGMGIDVTSTVRLPPQQELQALSSAQVREHLQEAVVRGREALVGDVVLLIDPNHDETLRRLSDGLMDLPSTVHLGGWSIIDRFPGLRTDMIGRIKTLILVRSPLTSFETVAKRAFDVCLTLVALILVSPILLVAAAAIRIDSSGPIFFRQRRRGFNQREFRIWKFRTMSTLDDGDEVVQAQKGDNRITRVGALLRRTNIDELPQLFNVLQGEMSLVGPRPHAIAHDRHMNARSIATPAASTSSQVLRAGHRSMVAVDRHSAIRP